MALENQVAVDARASSAMLETIEDPSTDAIVTARQVNFWFGEGDLSKQILFDCNLTIYPGEVIVLNGPSGCGKTTLLTLISALRTLRKGSLQIFGQELRDASPALQVSIRRRIGFIFQLHNLLPHLNAVDNVRVPLDLHPKITRQEGIERAKRALTSVGLEKRMWAYPAKLSGGQKQRVAIARALIADPQLILADEPTSALDGQTGREVVDLLIKLSRERGTPVLMVTHDPRLTEIADRILVMDDGHLRQSSAADHH